MCIRNLNLTQWNVYTKFSVSSETPYSVKSILWKENYKAISLWHPQFKLVNKMKQNRLQIEERCQRVQIGLTINLISIFLACIKILKGHSFHLIGFTPLKIFKVLEPFQGLKSYFYSHYKPSTIDSSTAEKKIQIKY